ncbi:MAG: HAMP domain-containing protein [Herminiimonas sp.]|nr:HAMP domain-containing protein [Herminiimonas sp.]
MTLGITKKIALSIIGIVLVCLVTMVLVTAQNFQQGFIGYLNDVQARQLVDLSGTLSGYYRHHGNFDRLRQNPRAFNRVLNQEGEQVDESRRTRPGRPGRPPPPPPPPPQYGRPPLPPDLESDDDPARPPVSSRTQPESQHALIVGPRLSLIDINDQPVVGPPRVPRSTSSDILVDGRKVGMLVLAPMQKLADATAADFVRAQFLQLFWMASAMLLLSILLAVWLARHLLRPVDAVREATLRIARGELATRVPIGQRDELGALAAHVNAMAQALEHNEQKRRQVLADVAHELRTPLTVMRGEIEALVDGIRALDRTAMLSLHAEALHLNKLVDDLYQLALADAGDLHYKRECLDLVRLTGQVAQRYGGRAEAAGLVLIPAPPCAPLMVLVDADRLTQVLGNLLENSLRYTDAGGRIVLALGRQAGHAVLTIDDSAPGVGEADYPRLFDRLYRTDPARSRVQGGIGLGLSICQSLVVAQGGTIHASGSALGGVRVTLMLPLLEERDAR